VRAGDSVRKTESVPVCRPILLERGWFLPRGWARLRLEARGMAVKLYQFLASHFNEKARWTLDLKGVPHERVTLLPGPHILKTQRLSGQPQTPVLADGDEVVAGSARIVEHLEERYPDPALYPADADERRRALAIQHEFDEEVGPAIRLAKFFEVMDADYAVGTFCREASAPAQFAYRAAFPAIRAVMGSSMGINAANAERARERLRRAFGFVAEKAGKGGYLVGDRFTIADLVCAALLMPAVRVDEWGGPEEASSAKNEAWLAAWADHPGAAWVRTMYRQHRRPRG
jgi:glutathione S-transferase